MSDRYRDYLDRNIPGSRQRGMAGGNQLPREIPPSAVDHNLIRNMMAALANPPAPRPAPTPTGGGVPQSAMAYPQLVGRGPAYGSQSMRPGLPHDPNALAAALATQIMQSNPNRMRGLPGGNQVPEVAGHSTDEFFRQFPPGSDGYTRFFTMTSSGMSEQDAMSAIIAQEQNKQAEAESQRIENAQRGEAMVLTNPNAPESDPRMTPEYASWLQTLGTINDPGNFPPDAASKMWIGLLGRGKETAVATGKKFGELDDATRLKVQEGMAYSVYRYVKFEKDRGTSDAEIVNKLHGMASQPAFSAIINTYIPVSLWSASDEEKAAFVNGLIHAYDSGYTAYGREYPIGGVGMGATAAEPVAKFDPGARSAHEFIAGERGWIQRTVNDLAESPFNWAFGPARSAGSTAAKYGTELTARNLAEEGAMAAAKRAAGRAITVAGKTAAVPDVALNKAADNLVSGFLHGIGEAMRGAPGEAGAKLENLLDMPSKTKAIAHGQDDLDAMRYADNIENGSGPGAVSPMGGMPQPKPGPVTPTIPPQASVMGTSTGGEPGFRANSDGQIEDIRARYTGEGVPVDPKLTDYPTAGPGPVLPRDLPGGDVSVPDVRTPGSAPGPVAPGRRATDRIGTGGRGGTRSVEINPDIGPTPIEEAVIAESPPPTGTMADVPEMGTPGARQQRPNVMPEDRNAAIRAGEMSAFEPYESGNRLIDDAAAAGRTGDPAKVKAWEDFNAANQPKRDAAWEIDRTLEEQEHAAFKAFDRQKQAEIKAEQAVNGIEHTVYDVAGDYVDHIGPLPDIPVLAARKETTRAAREGETLIDLAGTENTPGGQRIAAKPGKNGSDFEIGASGSAKVRVTREADGTYTVRYKKEVASGLNDAQVITFADGNLPGTKPSFMEESNQYLAQRYVYQGDESALAVLQSPKRTYPYTKEQIQRLKDARQALVDIQENSARRLNLRKLDAERKLAVDASRESVVKHVDMRLRSSKLSKEANPASRPPAIDKEYGVLRVVAGQSESMNDGVARLEDYGTGAYGVRTESVTEDLTGGPRYAKTPDGAGWRRVDQIIELFKKWWAEAQRTYAVDPNMRRLFRMDKLKAELPKADRPRLLDPSTELPEDVRIRMDETPFTTHPRFQGMSLRKVRDSIELEVRRDVARINSLTDMGYKPKVTEKSSQFIPAPGEMVIKVGEEAPTTPKGKPKPITEKRPVAGSWNDPNEELYALQQKYVRYSPEGDVLKADPREMANELAARAREYDIDPELGNHPHLAIDLLDAIFHRSVRHELLANPITSWGYSGRNVIGNIMTSAMGTQGRSIPRILEAFKTAIRQTDSMADIVMRDAGIPLPSQYTKKSITAMDLVAKGTHTPTRQLAERAHLGWIARKYDAKRGVDAALEYGAKLEYSYVPMFQHWFMEDIASLSDQMAAYAGKRGIPLERDELMSMFVSLRKSESRVFDRHDLYDGVYRLAKSKGMSDEVARAMAADASRKFQGMVRQTQLRAIEKTNHIFPSQRRMTNLDHYASYVTLFHFWPTRTSQLVLEEMIRNPQILNLWFNAHDGLDRMAEEGNYPESAKYLIALGNSWLGFMLYANPAAFYLVASLDPRSGNQPDPQNVTKLGKWLLWSRENTGLAPTPFTNALLNMAGVYGNSFPPNPWPSRTAELAGAAIDVILVKSGHGPGTPVYDNTMSWLRAQVSGRFPGTTNIPYRDQSAYTQDLVGSMVLEMDQSLAARMQAVGPDGYPTEDALSAREQFDTIMQNPDDPAYVAAETRVAEQNLFTRAMNSFSPLTISAKMTGREQTIEASRAGRENRDAGLPVTPEQQGAANLRGDVTATNEARSLEIMRDRYEKIGTPRQQGLSKGWTEIVYGVDDHVHDNLQVRTGPGDNDYVDVNELRTLDPQDRMEFADAWVASQDGTADLQSYREERSKFEQDNPEFGSAQNWKDTARDFKGGVRAFRLNRAAGNGAFRTAMDAKKKYLLEHGTDPSLVEDELDAWALTLPAYEAAHGVEGSIYDPQLGSTGDQPTFDAMASMIDSPSGSGSGSGSGSSSKKTEADRIKLDMADYNKEMAVVADVLDKYGFDKSALESNNPVVRNMIENVLGESAPKPSKRLKLYWLWRDSVLRQDPSADVSLEAYQRVLDQMGEDAAA